MKVFLPALIAALIATVPAAAQQKGSDKQSGRPKNLSRYSLQFWPQDTLRAGQIVSAETPYGTLTCHSVGKGERNCTLK